MRFFLRLLRARRGGSLAEFALVAAPLLLVSLGLINLAAFGVAGANANNAANYGARMGAVAQENQTAYATNATWEKLSAAPIGTYEVSVSAPGAPGGLVAVQVTYTVPNFIGGLTSFFGVGMPDVFQRTAISYFRQEGWTP